FFSTNMLSLAGQIFIVTKNARIAGVSPACGCTQPLMSEVLISTAFLFALRQIAVEMAAFFRNFLLHKILSPTSYTYFLIPIYLIFS
ncbi:MAG: hypothetical protein LBP59_16835, partial [Planctomycetaceae bacterium]|nr:hypothetical protein [Planctomycetaceae bacterium]